jgi:hypothetical protein
VNISYVKRITLNDLLDHPYISIEDNEIIIEVNNFIPLFIDIGYITTRLFGKIL